MASLLDFDVLAVDCQATAAAPRGHLIELGWARLGPGAAAPRSRLVALPADMALPPAVARITGISPAMMRDAVPAADAWRELCADLASSAPPARAIAHFARFERPFLDALAGVDRPLDLVCTHEIARRLLPDLPRCTLRAVAGYFGGGIGACRRSADHVNATAFVWRELATLLAAQGVGTWEALRAWLAAPPRHGVRRGVRRAWPMPRELRLRLPDAPGIYRMLRTSGDVLYVGKASSLHHRVNSYFRKQHGVPERLLEMLSQARDISVEATPTALEAALLEADEIKRLRPPYNIALTEEERQVWFATRDLTARARHPSSCHCCGPLTSPETIDEFAALAGGGAEARHLLRLGTELWRSGRRERDLEPERLPLLMSTPEEQQAHRERIALRATLARRRGRWLTRLFDCAVTWQEPGADHARLLVLERGEIVRRESVPAGAPPPVPPGYRRSVAERREAFTVASFDRLRVLLTELRRVACEGAPIAVRLGTARPLTGARLARVLSWV